MRRRPAFTVVEVLVALIILSVAALGSAAAVGMAAREHTRAAARRDALDATRAQTALLSAAPCDSLADGQRMIRDVVVQWTVPRDTIARLSVVARHRGTITALRAEVACE
jgi:prepilin-type N-terminal cleavage/methylation domain-containing protein